MKKQTDRELLEEMYEIYGYLAEAPYSTEEIQKYWKKVGENLGINSFKQENPEKQIGQIALSLVKLRVNFNSDETVSDVAIRLINNLIESNEKLQDAIPITFQTKKVK